MDGRQVPTPSAFAGTSGFTPADASTDPRNPTVAAERLSINAFFNALSRESDLVGWATPPGAGSTLALCVTLPSTGARIWAPVRYRSICGRHQFVGSLLLQAAGEPPRPVSLNIAAARIADEPRLFPDATVTARQAFSGRVDASVCNLADAIAARSTAMESLFEAPLNFAASEQALLAGHSVHPTPKSREPLTQVEARLYAPEFGGRFALRWLGVDRDCLIDAHGDVESATAMARAVHDSDVEDDLPPVSENMVRIPAHPWQWQQLRDHPRVRDLLRSGRIIELGDGRPDWHATSSLRAIHASHSPYMLKCSMSLRLTNSLRTLQPGEMARGLEVPRIRRTPVGQAFEQRYPQFRVLAEPGYLMLRSADSEPIIESLVLFRDNPFRDARDRSIGLLATLTQDHPWDGDARVVHLVRQHIRSSGQSEADAAEHWFRRFCEVAIEPLVIAQADYGLLYGAHQQNLILGFDGGLPARCWFRDCQGSGYSALGAKLLRPFLPDLGDTTDNVIDDTMANRLFAYYLIVNSCFGLIGALGASGVITEARLLQVLRDHLASLRDGGREDSRWLDYVLDAPELWAKGNFQCALLGLNETTTADPLAIYHPLPNPLAGL